MSIFGISKNKKPISTGNVITQTSNTEDDSLLSDAKINEIKYAKTSSKNKRKNILFNRVSRRKNDQLEQNIVGVSIQPQNANISYQQPTPSPSNQNWYLSQRSLNVSQFNISNTNYTTPDQNGISTFRPEILSLHDFLPAFSNENDNLDDIISDSNIILEFLNLQIQNLNSRDVVLKKILDDMQKSSFTKDDLNSLNKDFNDELNKIKNIISFYGNIIDKINLIKSSLDIKNIPKEDFANSDKFLTLSQFFDKYMQFSENEYAFFTETKIYNQFIADFRNTLENYSYSLLNIIDNDRINNNDPITIDTSFNINQGFSFKPVSISSTETNIINASNNSFFNSFLNSLPQNYDDRIKIILNFISKELRISKGLGRTDIQNDLATNFTQGAINNPFDNMFGQVGTTIFQQPSGLGSLASLSFVKDGENIILPFENVYITSNTLNNNTSYIPGTAYFADSIVDFNNSLANFNISPFLTYANVFTNKTNAAINILNKLFEFDTQNSNLTQTKLADYFLFSFQKSIMSLGSKNNVNSQQLIVTSLFRLANSNSELKNLLFDFCILSGLASSNSANQKKIFDRLKKDMPTLNSLYSFKNKTETIELNSDIKALSPYINELADRIEAKIYDITYGTNETTSLPNTNNSNIILESKDFYTSFPRTDIKNKLINLVTTLNSTNTNLIKEFIDTMIYLNIGASKDFNEIYLTPDDSGRTRNNFISTSTMMLLVFECYVCFAKKYADCDYQVGINNSSINIKMNYRFNDNIIKFINAIVPVKPNIPVSNTSTAVVFEEITTIPPPAPPLNTLEGIQAVWRSIVNSRNNTNITPTQSTEITNDVNDESYISVEDAQYGLSIKNIKDKLAEEDVYILNAINILKTFYTRILNAKTNTTISFSKEIFTSFIIQNKITADEIKILKNNSQLRTSFWILDRYLNNVLASINNNNSKVLVSRTINKTIKDSLLLMLKETKFLEDKNSFSRKKILTFGIPNGFSNHLNNSVDLINLSNNKILNKETDIIQVNLYKRDIRFDDIVFKPKSFYYDLSLYPSNQSDIPDLTVDAKWFVLTQNILLNDYNNPKSPNKLGYLDILNNERYYFLNEQQKIQMITNHLESMFLNIYIQLMSGFRIDEETFTTQPVDVIGNYDERIYNLILNYIRNIKLKSIPQGLTINDILNNQTIDIETKDILTLLTYGNLLFQPSAIRKRILNQKTFDRVFSFIFDIDDFEIDLEKTLTTQSGKKSFTGANVQNAIINKNNKIYLKPRDAGDLVFDDYFIVINNNNNNI